MDTAPTTLRSGQVATEAGVNPQTLRYYERRGLIAEPTRSPGGHRLYPAATVRRLRVIKAAQRLGFTLDEVAELIDAGRTGMSKDTGLRASAEAKLVDVERRIADLDVIRHTLRRALDAGCDDLTTCASASDCPLPFTEITH
ncbi:MerR family transcriptional regulator [Haloechinothrix salitolerans]|uniref:MerR family transcriptional regulator n=1 Tax=Haloechinothrix salitolerans TaxID=926830 RepID=A0ABW2C7C6_9PSEU